jgi:predicted transcriptional regulator
LIAACDEFIYYDDLVREAQRARTLAKKSKRESKESDKRQEALDRLVKIVQSLELDYDPLWGSMLKQAIRRVHPDFNEGYYGYRNFSDLLEEGQALGLIDLEHDEARGNYKVRLKKDQDIH